MPAQELLEAQISEVEQAAAENAAKQQSSPKPHIPNKQLAPTAPQAEEKPSVEQII